MNTPTLRSPLRTALALCALVLVVGAPFARSVRGAPEVTRAEVRETDEGWRLFLDGEPFFIEGAGLEFGSIEALAGHGANSFRTWRTDDGRRSGEAVLDEAQRHGLKVTMGIEVAREEHGFDYGDEDAVAAQLARVRREVEALKDHPALIVWCIGNELNLGAVDPRVWDAVNGISEMIHRVDPDHLTTTALAGMRPEVVAEVAERADDLDILSVQMYREIESLHERIEASGWDGPLMVTEWGATGHWEVAKTEWGAPLENDSSTKADLYGRRYREAILSQTRRVIGSYVFLWGQKQERTPTWYGMFTEDGRETESIDVMHRFWTGEWPDNRAPRVVRLTLDGAEADDDVRLEAGRRYRATFEVEDPDRDRLDYRWVVMRESESTKTGGERERVPETLDGLISRATRGRATLRAPKEPGAYRLFAYADDKAKNTAHANIPFLVE